MPSAYPGAYDNFDADHTAPGDDATLIRPTLDQALDALNKMQAESGLDPSGSFATVRARLDQAAVSGKGFVLHGTNAGTARPTGYASVEWVGSVEPTNAIDGDTWVNTA